MAKNTELDERQQALAELEKTVRNIAADPYTSLFDDTYTNFGSRAVSGRQRVVLPGKTNLRCYSAIDTTPTNPEPVVAVSLLPVAPLANAFET